MKMNEKLFAKCITALILVPPVVGVSLGIAAGQLFKGTDWYAQNIATTVQAATTTQIETTTAVEQTTEEETTTEILETTTKVVEKSVDNVNKRKSVEPTTTESAVQTLQYTQEELEILAIIIYQEAGGDACSDDTRRKVGSVFINRVNSNRFPNTFWSVATQPGQYGFSRSTGVRWPYRAKNSNERNAVNRAYRIAKELLVNGSILPSNVVWQAQFKQGKGVYAYQDNTYFCY